MAFQGSELTLAMTQCVMHLTLHGEEERKPQPAVSTRPPTLRTAPALGIGDIPGQRLMAEYRQQGDPLAGQAPKPRGPPACRAAVPLPPVMRSDVRTKQ